MDKLIATYYRRGESCNAMIEHFIEDWNPLSLKENQYAFNHISEKITRDSSLEEIESFVNSAKMFSIYETNVRKIEEFSYFFSAIKCYCANRKRNPQIQLIQVEDDFYHNKELIPWIEYLASFEEIYAYMCK